MGSFSALRRERAALVLSLVETEAAVERWRVWWASVAWRRRDNRDMALRERERDGGWQVARVLQRDWEGLRGE